MGYAMPYAKRDLTNSVFKKQVSTCKFKATLNFSLISALKKTSDFEQTLWSLKLDQIFGDTLRRNVKLGICSYIPMTKRSSRTEQNRGQKLKMKLLVCFCSEKKLFEEIVTAQLTQHGLVAQATTKWPVSRVLPVG